MIANAMELNSAVEYAVKLADSLEGLRLFAEEAGEAALLPLSSAGPLAHLRDRLADIRVYTERLLPTSDTAAYAMAASMSFGVSAVSASESERTPETSPR